MSSRFLRNSTPSSGGVLLAGSQYDGAFDIAVDARGHVFVAGLTGSVDFPVTANALQKRYGGGEADAFFAEINPEGKLLEVSFLGGSEADRAFTIAIEGETLWLGGATWSSDFPGVTDLSHPTPANANAFVARLSPGPEDRIRSTITGGSGYEKATGIALTGDGELFVVGLTESADFPVIEAHSRSPRRVERRVHHQVLRGEPPTHFLHVLWRRGRGRGMGSGSAKRPQTGDRGHHEFRRSTNNPRCLSAETGRRRRRFCCEARFDGQEHRLLLLPRGFRQRFGCV